MARKHTKKQKELFESPYSFSDNDLVGGGNWRYDLMNSNINALNVQVAFRKTGVNNDVILDSPKEEQKLGPAPNTNANTSGDTIGQLYEKINEIDKKISNAQSSYDGCMRYIDSPDNTLTVAEKKEAEDDAASYLRVINNLKEEKKDLETKKVGLIAQLTRMQTEYC